MTKIRLEQLPDRTPVKLTISISPDLHRALRDYAEAYTQVYGTSEDITDLVPAMLCAFLDSDRAFMRARKAARSE